MCSGALPWRFDRAAAVLFATQPRLNWAQAVQTMRAGAAVRRVKDMRLTTLVEPGEFEEVVVLQQGTEAITLRVAVTDDYGFCRVFQGAQSHRLFEPSAEDKAAEDWLRVEDPRLW
jgi:alpha-beta hydrolase superfamily lysophospholipase